jgi:TolB-like protein/Tfp pilus assembly protein PilF
LSILSELARRNVFRVAIAYAVAAWVILQIMDVVTPILGLPGWAPKLVFVLLAIGFVAALVASWVYELTPDGLRRDADVHPDDSIRRTTGRKLNYVIVAMLVGALALVLINRSPEPDPAPADDAQAAAEATPAATPSIAVLPFVNMSSDPEQEYFSDGITEEILNSLASVKDLRVAGRTSSFAFKDQADDLRRIGTSLGVDHILEGSVRKSGNEVRITAQLIQVEDGFHVWSQTYERELTDVFAIQDEIAKEILAQLKTQLLADTGPAIEAQRTTPEAYDLYLRAKQRIYTRERSSIETAVRELDEAIRVDAAYAPAYAQRAIAVMLLSEQQYGDIPHDEAQRRAKRFVDQALELDPNNAEALAALGLYYRNEPGEVELAIEPLTKALELNPNLIDASNWLQIALQELGDYRGAKDIVVELTERDPLYSPAFANAIITFNNFSEKDRAEELLQRMEAFDPSNPDLLLARAINEMYSGNVGEGLKLMERYRDLTEMSGVGQIYLSVGLIETMQFDRATTEGSLYLKPEALFRAGRSDEAFELAYQLARSGYPQALFRLFIWTGRDQDLVDYLEERWPSLNAFAAEVRGDDFGYGVMIDVALAYTRLDNQLRFEEAMAEVERHHANLKKQGMNNVAFSLTLAVQHTLDGNREEALDALEHAVEQGAWINDAPSKKEPALVALANEPRFAAVEERMRANLNRNREVVGLPPVDANYTVTAQLAP